MATMVAVMRPGKGHDVLLDALPLFHDGIVVVLVGDGELAAEVRDRARRFEGRVIVTGFREDVPRLLAGSDLLIHPSQADALPTAVVQAAAGGATSGGFEGRWDSRDRHRRVRNPDSSG